ARDGRRRTEEDNLCRPEHRGQGEQEITLHVEARPAGGKRRRLARALDGRGRATLGRGGEGYVRQPDVTRREDPPGPRDVVLRRTRVPRKEVSVGRERGERGVGCVARALHLLDLADLDRRPRVGEIPAQLVRGGALERAGKVLAREHEAARAVALAP